MTRRTGSRYPGFVSVLRNYVRQGDFVLSSGKQSDVYVDVKALAFSRDSHILSVVICDHIWNNCHESYDFEAIATPELGLTMLLSMLSYSMQKPAFMVRKESKAHGITGRFTPALDSLKPGSRVVLIDDVLTTGRSMEEAHDAIEAAGHRVDLWVPVVDRRDPGSAPYRVRGKAYYAPLLYARDLIDSGCSTTTPGDTPTEKSTSPSPSA